MAMMHLLGAATVWCEEPIKLHVHPPSNAQAREYVAARGQLPLAASPKSG